MSEKRGRGQPKFEPTPEQRSLVKLMKATGIPEDRICKRNSTEATGTGKSHLAIIRNRKFVDSLLEGKIRTSSTRARSI